MGGATVTDEFISASAPQLITYADRIGGDIAGVRALLDDAFSGAFGGVHLLPFYPNDIRESPITRP